MLSNSVFDFWSYAQSGAYNTFAFRGAQMDRYGNVNNTVIGPYDNPKVRLPGGGGMADLGGMIPNIYLWSSTHDRRTFVETLDFRSGIGWGDGGDHRARLGARTAIGGVDGDLVAFPLCGKGCAQILVEFAGGIVADIQQLDFCGACGPGKDKTGGSEK